MQTDVQQSWPEKSVTDSGSMAALLFGWVLGLWQL